jgi:hypothetical protein
MCAKRMEPVAERAVVRAIAIGIGKLLLILLDGTAEWV